MSNDERERIEEDVEDSSDDAEYTPSESSSTSSSSTVSSAVSSSTATTESESSDSETESEEGEKEEPKNEKITLRKTKGARGRWKLLNDKNTFRKEWEAMYDWVQEHPSDPKMAICNKCYCIIKAQKNILDSHQKSKKHMRNTGELVEETPRKDEPRNDGRSFNFGSHAAGLGIGSDGVPYQVDENINFFTESAADAAHQAVTSIIDKLVEKYHKNRLENLKIQNEAVLQLERERTLAMRLANQRQLEHKLQREAYKRDAEETSLKLLQIQHEAFISAMEKEKDAKLKAVEQELVFAKQEYEKKVKLLDSQLSSMK